MVLLSLAVGLLTDATGLLVPQTSEKPGTVVEISRSILAGKTQGIVVEISRRLHCDNRKKPDSVKILRTILNRKTRYCHLKMSVELSTTEKTRYCNLEIICVNHMLCIS